MYYTAQKTQECEDKKVWSPFLSTDGLIALCPI